MVQQHISARLVWEDKGESRTHSLVAAEVSLGRKGDSDLVFKSSSVSREHAIITLRGGRYFIKDLGSSFGTWLDEQELQPFTEMPLESGQTILLGRQKISFLIGDQKPVDVCEVPALGMDLENPEALQVLNKVRTAMQSRIDQFFAKPESANLLKQGLNEDFEELDQYIRGRFNEFQVLQEVSQIIVGILDLRELLSTVLTLASRVLKADRGFILLYDAVHNDLRSMVTRHFDEKKSTHEHDFNFSQTIARRCFEKKEVEIIADALKDERFDSAHSIVASTIRSVVCLPLIKGEQVSGVLYLDNTTTPNCFNKHQMNFLKSFAAQTALALDNARLYTQAVTDGLTGLYNRKFVDERIVEEMVRSRRYDRQCSVILLDVDFFKKVNDTYGHHTGDVVLQRIAGCLQEEARGSDIVARYGGEEFLMLLTETDEKGAMVFAERLRVAVSEQRIDVDGTEIQVTISCGVSTYRRDFRSSVKAFVNEADQGLYRAKQTGRNRVCTMLDEA